MPAPDRVYNEDVHRRAFSMPAVAGWLASPGVGTTAPLGAA
jgi:hypothetical protein